MRYRCPAYPSPAIWRHLWHDELLAGWAVLIGGDLVRRPGVRPLGPEEAPEEMLAALTPFLAQYRG